MLSSKRVVLPLVGSFFLPGKAKETIEERLVVYNNKTKPIITYYESLGILVPVNSNQEPSKVIDEIINKVN